MLKIYPVAIEMVRDVNALCPMVARYVPALSDAQRNRFEWILGVLHKVAH
jgi:hypothetical protein